MNTCVLCRDSTLNRMVCSKCIGQEQKREVKKLRYSNCEVCAARKARNQKVKDLVFVAVKAGFATAFQLVATVAAVYFLLTEGVIP